jgi:NADH:quinone reductase (non-electrogenic)
MDVTKKRILILGGGFCGVYVAVHLGKMLSRSELEETEIALVNRENYIVFQPLLPEVISGSVELNHVITPIRRMAPRANLYTRDIESIDPVARTVTLSPGVRPTPLTLSYDHLVIAMGTRLAYSKIPGMREHASPFKYLGDALYLRNQLVRMLEEAEAESDRESRKRLLTFVVAGGGFSGVECIAEMNDFLREAVGAYHNIAERDLRLILLQRGERILPEVTPSLAAFAHKLLVKRGVEIRLGAGLKALTANAVVVEDKQTRKTETIGTRTAVATVPAGPHPILTALPLPQKTAASSSIRRQRSQVGLGYGRLAIARQSSKWTEIFRDPARSTPFARPRPVPKTSSPPIGVSQKNTLDSPAWESLDHSAGARRSRKFSAFVSRDFLPGCCGAAFTSRSFRVSTVSFA